MYWQKKQANFCDRATLQCSNKLIISTPGMCHFCYTRTYFCFHPQLKQQSNNSRKNNKQPKIHMNVQHTCQGSCLATLSATKFRLQLLVSESVQWASSTKYIDSSPLSLHSNTLSRGYYLLSESINFASHIKFTPQQILCKASQHHWLQ